MPKDPNRQNLGLEGERAVQEAFQELMGEDKKFVGYLKAKSSDRLDAEGIDILIFVRGGFALPIQVRTTKRRIFRFRDIHPMIRFVLFIKKRRRNKDTLDKNSPQLYRSTLDYIKKKIQDFTGRAIRDICQEINPVVK